MTTRLQDPPNLKQALELNAEGLWSHAIHEKGDQQPDGTRKSGKRPIGNAWGVVRWDEKRLRDAFKDYPGAGVGVALGPGRGPGGEWLGDLEGDGPEAAESLNKLLGWEVIDTRGWGSTRGGHGLWIMDGDRLLKLLAEAGATEGEKEKVGVWHLDEFPGLEFRIGGYKKDGGVKQVQSVCPPTIGDDGNHRTWNGVETIAVLPESAYSLLAAIAESHRMRTEAEALETLEAQPAAIHESNGHSNGHTNGDPFTMTVESSRSAYGRKALEGEVDEFSRQGEGGRHAYLLRATLKLASLVKAGALDAAECLTGLKAGALKNGMGQGRFHEIDAAWQSGLAMANARVIPESTKRTVAATNAAATPETDADVDNAEVLDRWPTYPTDAFYGLAGKVVALADPHCEGDPVATLVQFLVGFGNLIDRRMHFVVGATRHYLNLLVLLIGATAVGRKGTSWDVSRHILEQLDPAWCKERIQSGLVSGEGLIYHVRDPVFKQKHDKAGKPTGELILVDEGSRDKRLLVVETEMARVLKAMNRDGNTLSEVIRQVFDSGNLGNLAKNSANRATDVHVSIIGHVTSADVRKHLTETDTANGFANRFIWAAVRRSKLLPDGGNLLDVDWSPIQSELSRVMRIANGSSNTRMTRDPVARKAWHSIYEELSAAKHGIAGKILSRAEAQVMRLACVYSVLDGSDVVRIEHLKAAGALWEYCESSVRLVFGDALGDPNTTKLLAALNAAPSGLTKSEINSQVFNRNKKAGELAAILSDLLTAGLIHRKSDSSTGGRKSERWLAGKGTA